MSIEFKAADLAQYFPLATQQQYVEQFHQRYDYLTRYQAECFVRLWGYCLIKRHTERASALPSRPLDSLEPLDRSVSCTQREAAELFYAGRERGSDRSAGMMLDKLADKKLVRKEFDGNLTYISICPPAGFIVDEEECQALGLVADDFNDRTDAVPVASFLKKTTVGSIQNGKYVLTTLSKDCVSGQNSIRKECEYYGAKITVRRSGFILFSQLTAAPNVSFPIPRAKACICFPPKWKIPYGWRLREIHPATLFLSEVGISSRPIVILKLSCNFCRMLNKGWRRCVGISRICAICTPRVSIQKSRRWVRRWGSKARFKTPNCRCLGCIWHWIIF
ncbi:MAG: hypothetical protein HC857_08575 [Synechococcales cyanobacterium RU_4_20]|nr:hypothetical protein [Synechococcales cyanobacterium RU_4_20]